MTIEQQIQKFLNDIPNITENTARRALLLSASLDDALLQQIHCDMPLAQWTPSVVKTLRQYGILADGRDAIITVLEAAKTLVGAEKQVVCDHLIQQWRNPPPIPPDNPQENRKCPITYSLRPQVRHFFDRDDILAQLITELRDAQKVMVMIDGIAGIGKTSLAVKVTEAVELEFIGVYYKKCTPDTDAEQLLAELAYFLSEHGDHRLASVFEYGAQQEFKVNTLVESLAKRRYLLLFDDVHELLGPQSQTIVKPDLDALFTSLLTQSHQSKILLASRIRPIFLQAQMSQVKNQLGPIEQHAGIEFLRQMQIEEDTNLLQQAYAFTGGHPLTMELLAALTETMPLEDILADRRLFWNDTIVAEKLLQKIYTTLMPEEQTLILKISILPRPVSNKVICALGESQDTIHILQSLVRKSLVTYDPKLKVYRLHDLVRDFHRLQLTEQQNKEYHLKAAAYYENLEFNKDKPTFAQVQQRLEAQYHYFQMGKYEKAAQLLLTVSEHYRTWGHLQHCRTLLEESITALESLSPTPERQLVIVDLLIELSWVKEASEGNEQATVCCQKAESILRTVEDKNREGNVCHAMARFLYIKSNWDEAEAYYLRAFGIKKQGEIDTNGLVKVLKDLLNLYWDRGELEKIEAISNEGMEACQQQGDIKSQAEILINVLGITFEKEHRFDDALVVYEKSLLIRETNDLVGKAFSLLKIGQILHKKCEFEHALKRYEESLIFAEQARDYVTQAYALQSIGDIYRDESKIGDAMKKYEESLKIVTEIEDVVGKLSVMYRIAGSYCQAGKIDKSLEQFERYLELTKLSGNIGKATYALNQIGFIYLTRYSELNKALDIFKESIELRKKMGRVLSTELEMGNIASVYREQGKLDEALKIHEGILKKREKKRDYNRAANLNYIGEIYCLKGEIQKAFESHRETLRLCEKGKRWGTKPLTLNFIGIDYIALGDYEKALLALEESYQLQEDFYRKAEPLTNIAEVYYRQGKLTEALAKCEESLALSHTYGGRIQTGVTLHLMGKIRLQEGKCAEALAHVQEAVTIFRETGSRHLTEAESTLQKIYSMIESGGQLV